MHIKAEPPYYAVIFTSRRTEGDNGYAEAAARMGELAAQQPGFLGWDAARTGPELGITVSYWKDEESIAGWRNHLEHAPTREHGRANWYEDFEVHVARVERTYRWTKES
ncbi:Heme-degrading monooxygenase HmoA [Amycolatopsis xylanica]|uniref:Heme-degrading monooxygenase HmoA n=1 Tax=Amycolatopsis xylanica TaxID=589385 RepID=A0A1H3SR93_9PSEU|nr:antibiotic biosynthesis monooxygenase [Amycolatopsis xylanica]SDZ40071.1 Heme-degrading monooxygenase HmoA [Amycolatopsis xylanica]